MLSSFAYITCRKPYVDAGGGVAGLKKGGSVLSAKVAALVLSQTGRHLTTSQSFMVVGAAALAIVWMLVSTVMASRVAPMAAAAAGGAGYGGAESFGMDDDFSRGGAAAPSLTERLQKAYDMGFEDSAGGKPKQLSYVDPLPPPPPPQHRFTMPTPVPAPAPKSSGFGIGQIINIGFLLKNLHGLGGSPWNLQTFMVNFQNMPMMQKVMMGFFAARLFGLSPF